jgi:hypothetical protein
MRGTVAPRLPGEDVAPSSFEQHLHVDRIERLRRLDVEIEGNRRDDAA